MRFYKSHGKEKASNNTNVQSKTGAEELLSLPAEKLIANLGTSILGLDSKKVEEQRRICGPNELAKKKRRTGIVEFLHHLSNPLIIILLIAGSISGFLGESLNTIIIFAMVFMGVVLDVYQESKAEKAASKLEEKVTTTATVIRDGAKKEIKLTEIVPGDVIYLSAGDIVPADARVLEAKDLFLDQSALTGESFPVEKNAKPLKSKAAAITEWNNCLFMGTSVVSGSATAMAIKTGNYTEYGKFAKKLVAAAPETEFHKGLRRFSFLIMEVTFILVLFVFLFRAVLNPGDMLNSFLFAVALAVGLTPELLPMIISLNLSRGALAMSNKGAIVKRLASIQNLGSMDVLCTDKTGTLTENKITLVLHVDVEKKNSEKVFLYSFLNSCHQTGLKSPLDEAVLKHEEINIDFKKIDEVPFDFTRRRVSVVVEKKMERVLIAKGAPEEIFKVCSRYELGEKVFSLTEESRKKIEKKYYDLSAEGFRVLGVSYKKVREKKQVYSVKDETEMVFLGFVAFIDPPKETARESLQLLQKAGIELKILTGDNEIVTKKTCEYLGFKIKGVVLGSEIEHMQDDALANVVEGANIFARVTPAQKDRIINVLKKNEHVVGYLGDGINDAPSLKTSDVGISVDNAVDVAKESADIILLQKSLRVLHDGVLEGRKTFGNTMKYIMMGVSSNFGNMFSAAGASLFLPFLPMLPIQILLNNLLYDLSEFAIPTDNVDPEYIQKPKRLNISFVKRFMLYFGPMSSIFDFLTFFIMLSVFNAWNNPALFQTAWFIESLCTQTLVIFVIRTRRSPFFKSVPSRALLISSLSIVAFAILLPATPIGDWFQFQDPPITFYMFLFVFIAAYLTLVEYLKRFFYKRYSI
jgi:Mg2+-importing ATPase